MRGLQKQELTDLLADALGVQRRPLGPGSKEHKEFLEDVARALGLSTDGGKHDLARRAVEAVGQKWDRDCYSIGDTVTSEAFVRVLTGLSGDAKHAEAVFQAHVEQLLKMPPTGVPPGTQLPTRVRVDSTIFVRSAEVAAHVLHLAGGKCEACGVPAPFSKRGGVPYLEVHHVVPLGEGGPDTVQNTVALCPNCHRRAHHASDARGFTAGLVELVRRRNAAWGLSGP